MILGTIIFLFIVFFLGFYASSCALSSDWDALREFRMSIFEKYYVLEGKVTNLKHQLADMETRLELEHEVRRGLEQKLGEIEGWRD